MPDAYEWKAEYDFTTLYAAGNRSPWGLWSSGTTMWVLDYADDRLYAYDLDTKERDSGRDFDTLAAAGNKEPQGIWSDGETMWVADYVDYVDYVDYDDGKLYAYDMATKGRVSGRDFTTLAAAGNHIPGGLWSDGETMWVADSGDDKLYDYNMPRCGHRAGPTTDPRCHARRHNARGGLQRAGQQRGERHLGLRRAPHPEQRGRQGRRQLDGGVQGLELRRRRAVRGDHRPEQRQRVRRAGAGRFR